ncbi:hypothetical protein L798_13273 [Zootermopsis nevadensis]|uniref:Uncharacterized protein n=1 Tax=Zootermopsis nevadensis TaxID=136037 RepID=A0A067QUR2_ZOONE|nr:hypothetical protein L798_13273 [Zootermopsis nevadensis]
MSSGVSTFKCVSCCIGSRASRDDNTPVRATRSASTADLPLKIVSPDRELILPTFKDPESLSVQLETVRLNGVNTHNLVENLVQMVLKLSEDVQQLQKDNDYLKFHHNKITCGGTTTLVYSVPANKAMDTVPRSASTVADVGSKSYKDVLSAGLKPKVSSVDTEGFTTVNHKKKSSSGMPSANIVKQRRQPLLGVRNSASLPIDSKMVRSKALFVSRFSPEATAADVDKSLKEQLSLKRLVCTRLKTKFNFYTSFHILVNEEDFPLVNNTGVWPNGCLIAPFYGKLTPDQVYSPDAPLTSVPTTADSDSATATCPATKPASICEELGGSISTS